MSNAAFVAAQAAEERNRLMAWLDRAPDLSLRTRGGRVLVFPVLTLRWRHVLTLLRSGNAFVSTATPAAGDVAEILWLLHPWHPANGGRAFLRVRLARVLVEVLSVFVSLPHAERELRTLLRDAFQDREQFPRPRDEEPSPLEPTLTQFDAVARHFILAGWTREQLLESGVAFTLQVLRAQGLAEGRSDNFVPPSAGLLKMDNQ
jgi:hypothetical protein